LWDQNVHKYSKIESKQGAATSADLLQQDQKLSAASADKERLAADIFTIGLQAKRLFVAQWKKLKRERKTREGTWTESKPPGKTPSSQDMGVVVSSGGVKRHHSDSSTPPLEKQQPKYPRSTPVQTGS
jgi:hypothetical protein